MVLLAIIGLSVVIFFHELGHFLTAKAFGIRVEEFGFGYPPRLGGVIFYKSGFLGFWKKNKIKFFLGKNVPSEAKKYTIYSINWVPFGGFNKLKGELGEGDDDPDSFFAQAWWKKALTSLGGAGMNVLLAIIVFIICYSVGIPQDLNQSKEGKIIHSVGIQINSIFPDSPAEKSGLKVGDVIKEIDGQELLKVEDFQKYVKTKLNNTLEMEVNRQGDLTKINIEVVPVQSIISGLEGENYGAIGVSLSQTAIVSYPFFKAVVLGVKTTFNLVWRMLDGLWLFFKNLAIDHKMIGEVSGPVGLTVLATQVARIGFVYFLQFMALISIAIGVCQIIPFPALDGSRFVFSLIEGIRRKPLNRQIENIIISIGFYILVAVLILITFKEVFNLF
jgi:regulator of sigma E protease